MSAQLPSLDSITVEQYFMGRDKTHAAELTPEIRANAANTVAKVNQLLWRASQDAVHATRDGITLCAVGSGWRPAGVNAATSNAAKTSTHLTGEACDIRDNPHTRVLCRWALENQDVLAELGLWCERPQWTPSWLHVQTRPPKSGLRFYVPSTAPPLVPALPGEVATA